MRSIASFFMIFIFISLTLSPLLSMDVEATDSNIIFSMPSNTGYSSATTSFTNSTTLSVVGPVYDGFLSFNCSSITAEERILTAKLNMYFMFRDISPPFTATVEVFRDDYGYTLEPADYPGSYVNWEEDSPIYTTADPVYTGWKNMNLNKSAINKTGLTQYILHNSGVGLINATFAGAASSNAPYLTIQTITETEAIITYNFTAGNSDISSVMNVTYTEAENEQAHLHETWEDVSFLNNSWITVGSPTIVNWSSPYEGLYSAGAMVNVSGTGIHTIQISRSMSQHKWVTVEYARTVLDAGQGIPELYVDWWDGYEWFSIDSVTGASAWAVNSFNLSLLGADDIPFFKLRFQMEFVAPQNAANAVWIDNIYINSTEIGLGLDTETVVYPAEIQDYNETADLYRYDVYVDDMFSYVNMTLNENFTYSAHVPPAIINSGAATEAGYIYYNVTSGLAILHSVYMSIWFFKLKLSTDTYTEQINVYPVEIIDWGSQDLVRYEFESINATWLRFEAPNITYTYLAISPDATITQHNATTWNITDLYECATYQLWFTRNKTAYCQAFISLYREATGEGIAFETWDCFINGGSDTDAVNMTSVNVPEITLVIGNTYTLSIYDYFPDSNFITNYTFIAINNTMDVNVPVPYGPLNFFSYREDFTAFRIWYNATGNPFQDHIPPESWYNMQVRGGSYMVAVDYLSTTVNGTIAVLDTYFLNITINSSVAYSIKISNSSIQTLITTVDNITITLDQYDIYFTPSQQNIYWLLPGLPVGDGTKSTLSAAELDYVWRHPHKITEADVKDVQTGTQQYFDSQLPTNGTVRWKTDYLFITGDISAWIFINSTTGNLVNYTGNPGLVDLTAYNQGNISVWSNTTLTCNRMSQFRQVEIFYWMYYPDTLKYTIGQSITNNADNQWTNVYWFLGFATNDDGYIETADTATIRVYDVDNLLVLDLGHHYDVTQAGIEMYFEYMNTSISRTFQFTYYLDNATAVPQSTPIISIRSYVRGTWQGTSMYKGTGMWVNNRTATYEGDISISLKNLNGVIDASSVVVYDVTNGRAVPDQYFTVSGSTITINADGTGTIANGESRSYEVYFLYDEEDVQPFFLFDSSWAIGWVQLTGHLLIFIAALFCAGYGVVELITARKQKEEAKGFGWVLIGTFLMLAYIWLWILHSQGIL